MPLTLTESRAQGLLELVALPEAENGKYPACAQADLTRLREAGYEAPMTTLEEGVQKYVEWLQKNV
jgi:ADP-L-glycero-D-manno-heptose 6-epimerase